MSKPLQIYAHEVLSSLDFNKNGKHFHKDKIDEIAKKRHESGRNVKVVYFIRHVEFVCYNCIVIEKRFWRNKEKENISYSPYSGEGHHNVFAENARKKFPELKVSPYTLEGCPFDPSLTDVGKRELDPLVNHFDYLFDPRPEMLVVSPLTRTIETGLRVIENRNIQKIVAHEGCREKTGASNCDVRRPRSELSERFPMIDFSKLENEHDETAGTSHEKHHEIVNRASKFMHWLGSPENNQYKSIAVASHVVFLLSLCSNVMSPHPEYTPSTGLTLGRRFETGEMRCYLIEWTENDAAQKEKKSRL